MKRPFHYLTVIALAALTLTGCDDVPMPYNQPNVTPDEPVNPSGSTSLPYSDTNLKDWTVKTIKGDSWSLGNTYAKATGYNNGVTTETESWLVSPKINTTTTVGAVITFDHVIRYVNNASDINNHEVYISTNYSDDVQTATWTKLNYKPVESATRDWTFYAADSIQIPDDYLNKDVVIAFKFTCSSSNSTTWEINNFKVTEGKVNGGGTTPTPTTDKGSTQDNPLSASEAVALITGNQIPSGEVYVKGIVSSVDYYNATYKSISYYISDDGQSKALDVYSGKGLNGADFNSKDDLKVGQEVIIYGRLTLYTNKNGEQIPEISQSSRIVSISGSGSTDTPDTPVTGSALSISGTTVTITNSSATAGTETATIDFSQQGLSNAADVTDFTLSDGTKIVFDGNGQRNSPKYYNGTKGIRVYLNNIITFEGVKQIAKIEMTCDSYNGTDYVGNAAATVSFDGNNVVYTNSDPAVTSGGGVQLRVKTITITYAQ